MADGGLGDTEAKVGRKSQLVRLILLDPAAPCPALPLSPYLSRRGPPSTCLAPAAWNSKGEEGRRILPARVMMQTGDYVLPWSEGKCYHRKPPLLNWSIAASFKALGGESEFAARLPSALSVLLLALTAVWAGRILAGPSGAWWLPLVILTTIGAVEKGRLAEIEALFFSLSRIGMLGGLAGWYRGGSPWELVEKSTGFHV